MTIQVFRPASSMAVCGAGMAGLALATLLARRGYRPVVFEARSEEACRTEGAFVTLAPNGLSALRALGTDRRTVNAGLATHAIELCNHHGRSLGSVDWTGDGADGIVDSVTIGRGTLIGILIDAARLAGVELHFDWRLTAVSEAAANVTLSFEGAAEPLAFDMVAAADGLGSAVRAAVFPDLPTPRYTGLVGTGGVGFVPGVPSTGGVMRMTFGRRAYFGYQKEGNGPVYWFNSYPLAERDLAPVTDPVSYMTFLRSLHEGDPDPIPRILAAVPAMERYYPINDLPPLATWHTQRVVLLGDAAHAVAPHAGQGASMALEDAVVLAACLDDATKPVAAFERFEFLRKARTRTVMEVARRSGARKRANGPISIFLRDLLLPFVLPLGARQARRIASFRVDQAPLALPA